MAFFKQKRQVSFADRSKILRPTVMTMGKNPVADPVSQNLNVSIGLPPKISKVVTDVRNQSAQAKAIRGLSITSASPVTPVTATQQRAQSQTKSSFMGDSGNTLVRNVAIALGAGYLIKKLMK